MNGKIVGESIDFISQMRYNIFYTRVSKERFHMSTFFIACGAFLIFGGTFYAMDFFVTKVLKKDTDNHYGITLIIAVILTIVFIVMAVSPSISSGGGGSSSRNTCKSCGRTFSAGDAAGNYKNIARTGMCNNCYGNYNWGKDLIGK